jgi:hypothetical protein
MKPGDSLYSSSCNDSQANTFVKAKLDALKTANTPIPRILSDLNVTTTNYMQYASYMFGNTALAGSIFNRLLVLLSIRYTLIGVLMALTRCMHLCLCTCGYVYVSTNAVEALTC